ncbi:maleylpyruvate isomerase family mycothiol-dependent enzyme [Modestobacter sp. I12A-02662]|uniref:maleylpyruvate isomerase family mycothiol-dependent enzyme n=1 Tax=Modestobacter sp. I12A-02662 TaxID=1730496 RepID=UPI0034DDF5C4
MTAPTEVLDWWERGERHLGTALGRLTDEEFDADSLLAGWSRRHVLAHLVHDADRLAAALASARSGAEPPAAPADGAPLEQVEALPPDQLRAAVLAATQRLAEAVRAMPDPAWSAQLRGADGHETSAAEALWRRCREAWVHAVDLAAGITFADVPDDVLAALVDDVFRTWDAADRTPDVVLFAGDREWGTGALAVAGPLAAATAWVTGRDAGEDLQADGPLPTLAPWI